MLDGFIKTAAVSPKLRVADCSYNAQQLAEVARQAYTAGARLVVTPELGLCGYTCGDLFLQRQLLDDVMWGLQQLCDETKALDLVLVAGLPLRHRGKLYNCAAVILHGRVLGLVPKCYPPNYAEFYELRNFAPAFSGVENFEYGFLKGVPIGMPLLFQCADMPTFTLAVEICEDLWVPAPPSIRHAMAGATVIANLSASNETVGKAEWRKTLVSSQSGRLVCGYVYADAGYGESTTDMVFAGHNIIAENGEILDESPLFSGEMALSEIDTERLAQDRQRNTSFHPAGNADYETIFFEMEPEPAALSRKVPRLPFVPENEATLAQRCETILSIQAAGLQKRQEHTRAETLIVGVSGGLDSSLALLVASRAFKALGRSPGGIMAVTMPGFGTTQRTKGNAEKLSVALGASLLCIDISSTTRTHFDDIGHGEEVHDVVYENAQARVRTLTLMDLANKHNGLVLGTGDLSELALGWATYNGDHMSMYGVNASVPKTLIRHLVAYEATLRPEISSVLQDVLDTPVSPELLPPKDGEISQKTEHLVGPYELHDFFLYYALRWGFTPPKILRLAVYAFDSRFNKAEILGWMKVFYRRFFSQQFKRSCMPDGPKVGSVSLSPRGDWRMPSDAVADGWLITLENL